jgi:hypothetical protein
MAEAAANDASYMLWPTWPQGERAHMISAIRPQADFLRENGQLLNDAPFRSDVLVLLPFRRWLETDHCVASDLAAALSKANVQYRVVEEEDLSQALSGMQSKVLVVESLSVLTPAEKLTVTKFEKNGGRVIAADSADRLGPVAGAIGRPSLRIDGSPLVRAVVHDQNERAIVHLLNLNVRRISSFQDSVTSLSNLKLEVRVPFDRVKQLRVKSADEKSTTGTLDFAAVKEGAETYVKFTIPQLEISSIVEINP